jgi:hypothetical protein
MTHEQLMDVYGHQPVRKRLDYIIDNTRLSAQSVNFQALGMTDEQITGWTVAVVEEMLEDLTTM